MASRVCALLILSVIVLQTDGALPQSCTASIFAQRKYLDTRLGSGCRRQLPISLSLRGGCEDAEEADKEGGDAEKEPAGEGDAGEEGKDTEEAEDEGPMTLNKALKQVLYYSRIHDGIARGVKEVLQALERGEAQLVLLAEDCDEAKYVKVLETYTAEKGVVLIKVAEKKQLGEWAGLVKLDAAGGVRKVCDTSSVAVKDFGEQSDGLAFLLEYVKANTPAA